MQKYPLRVLLFFEGRKMDKKIDPTPMTLNVSLSEEKYRKTFAHLSKDLPEKGKKGQSKKHSYTKENQQELLKQVDEVNAHLSSTGQNVLVLIQNSRGDINLKMVDTRNHETITVISPDEFYEVAQNLRNHKLTLIDRDV